jgi:transcriptional regulator with XRE-family HTH domain
MMVQDEPTPVKHARRRMQVDGVAFGRRLRQRRQQLGWSTEDLHAVTGVAGATINELENGKTKAPQPWVTHALAVALGCPSAGDLVAWMDARDQGRPYEPQAGRGTAFGPARPPGAGAAGAVRRLADEVRLDVLVEQLLRGVWRAQAAGEGRGSATQVTTLGVGLVLLGPRVRRGPSRRRAGGRGPGGRRGGAGVRRRKAT